ncbi:MAG: hypothetical protein WC966_12250 [Bradymonadales bacterium]
MKLSEYIKGCQEAPKEHRALTKNEYFYDYFDKCEKRLGEKRFKKHKLELIDVFQSNWNEYLKSKSPDDLVEYATSKVKQRSLK